MNSKPRILWLEGVFDESTIDAFPATSPAVNFWHAGFVSALKTAGCDISLIGHPYDRIWPAGRVFVGSRDAAFASGFSGKVAGYINMPFVRSRTQSINYLRLVKEYVAQHGRPDYVFTFNDTPATPAAEYLSRELSVPWIYIAGDGPALPGADGYLYQNWVYYESPSAPGPKIHLDGGLPLLEALEESADVSGRATRALMYMGALTEHGGAMQLARAFHSLGDQGIQLWVTGRGSNDELEQLAEADSRIKLYGFVGQEQLHSLASRAHVFANPRPTAFAPNKLNYPSKLLHYLAYGRPVISTFTDGLSPDYRDVLIPIEEESEAGLAQTIQYALGMPGADYAAWCARVARFNHTRIWSQQIFRLLDWLEGEFKQSTASA
ncbi:MAG: glycosyltransferase family 4 protein [Sedimenticola thiotaurini]|uniref:Glycosyltransferase family 4 protein n=1 Tax=Sedimenticola thiotaurini TaxID=1543721 RepID=A0A558DAS4_9GAMM|nr:MAG: glycosyltransferase family 4 protein [Sedimenticola thiotaurini]